MLHSPPWASTPGSSLAAPDSHRLVATCLQVEDKTDLEYAAGQGEDEDEKPQDKGKQEKEEKKKQKEDAPAPQDAGGEEGSDEEGGAGEEEEEGPVNDDTDDKCVRCGPRRDGCWMRTLWPPMWLPAIGACS